MRNSKKAHIGNIVSLVAVILLVLGIIAALGSTYEWAEQKFCEHTFGEKVVLVGAECGLDGVSEKSCTQCGYTKREAIPALGGDCDYVAQADGGYTCSKCGAWHKERRLTDPTQFRAGEWYRFCVDPAQEYSEATIVINLRRADSGCDGGYRLPGEAVDMDLPCVRIGVSTASQGKGYIFFGDGVWLSVDADVESGENYIDIYLDENVFTGVGYNDQPDIWFELTRETEATEITCVGGGYIVVLDGKPEV